MNFESSSQSPSGDGSCEPLWKTVKTVTLDDLPSSIERYPKNGGVAPLRILVTIHSIDKACTNLVKNGLGLWVTYILDKYVKQRNIPCKLFLKSIVVPDNHDKHGKATTLRQLEAFVTKHRINMLIPTDVTDTQFVSRNYLSISRFVKTAVSQDIAVYETLEDKWSTYKLCVENDIPTPPTKLFDWNEGESRSFPFFLKISSGTNGGRGVWFVQDQQQLDAALEHKECRRENTTLLVQKPIKGRIICGQIIYSHGRPLGFFFAESKIDGDLAGIGNKYIFSNFEGDGESHIKVELEDWQWEVIAKIFCQVGEETKYHGMIDIEFIIAGEDEENHVPAGSVWLLECNPRFSGFVHTTLSNPAFLDTYLDLISGRTNDEEEGPIINFSRGVEMKSAFKDFKVLPFYLKNVGNVAFLRNWRVGLGIDIQKPVASTSKSKQTPGQRHNNAKHLLCAQERLTVMARGKGCRGLEHVGQTLAVSPSYQ